MRCCYLSEKHKTAGQSGQEFTGLHRVIIGTRGHTVNATCTNTTGPQGDTRAILYDGNIEYELRGVLAKYTLCGLKQNGCIKVVSWGFRLFVSIEDEHTCHDQDLLSKVKGYYSKILYLCGDYLVL